MEGAIICEDNSSMNIDLHEENLENTELQNTNLQDTNLEYANLEGFILYEDIFCIDKDLLIYEEIKMIFKEYGWKVEMQVKEKIIDDKPVEFKQYVLTGMDR